VITDGSSPGATVPQNNRILTEFFGSAQTEEYRLIKEVKEENEKLRKDLEIHQNKLK
jgi:hypothetical protein